MLLFEIGANSVQLSCNYLTFFHNYLKLVEEDQVGVSNDECTSVMSDELRKQRARGLWKSVFRDHFPVTQRLN